MSGHDKKPDIHVALVALKDAFVKKTPAKIEEIQQSWQQLKATPENHELFYLLHRQAHTLAGTAATYGFEKTGSIAKKIERVLQDDLTADENTWVLEAMEKVETLLVQLTHWDMESIEGNTIEIAISEFQQVADNEEQSKLIYIVDDDADFLDVMTMQIKTFGYDVESFKDFMSFYEALKHKLPAVVVMDVMFGEGLKTGIEHIVEANACREQTLQTVFMTGRNDVLTRLHAVRAGGLAYFSKPIAVEHLVDVLDRLTHRVVEEPYRIVIVDDSQELSAYTALALQQAGMETREVNNPLQLLKVLFDFSPDLILMDVYMPDCSGLELSQVIRQMDMYFSTPIVYLSSEDDLKKRLGAMSLGGDDFLSKPIEPCILLRQ